MHLAALAAATVLAAQPAPTSDRIGVFSDQLPDNLSPGLVAFAASHYDGAQKLGRATTDALKRANPRFFAIQYRLALGLGRRTQVRFGDAWLPEWPRQPRERWFYRYRGGRVFQKQWGWYLMDVDDASWRAYYAGELRRQVATTHADGAFLDSASVPNELGGSSFTPALQDYSPAFEQVWTAKLERWLSWIRRRLGRPVIVNAGSWVTTRDRTSYAGVDGVMIEGFATDLAPVDWKLELTRALSLVGRDRTVIAQSYPNESDLRARMFEVASYLLIKGAHTYVNFGEGIRVSWYPEYGIDLGAAVDPPGLREEQGAFVRRFQKGIVVVNPGDAVVRFDAGATYQRVMPVGGGEVPASGQLPSSWRLATTAVSSLALGPREAAVLLR